MSMRWIERCGFGRMARLLVGLLVGVCSLPVLAQQTMPAEPGSELTVYLVTMGPGEAIYERFGHNAIWIRDRVRGTDAAYNFGVFDMGESGFIVRFLQGRMWYWLEAWSAGPMLDAYKRFDRSIWVQQLNLTPEQRLRLRDNLEENAKPENRRYRYDYYTDNCSTRVRDALDKVTGGQIQQQMKAVQTERTYRWHTRRIMESDPIMYTALYFVLGQPIDRPISAWEECFLPTEMQRHLRNVTIENGAGQRVPLVGREITVYESTRPPLAQEPPNWWAYYLTIGVAIGGAMAWLGWLAPKRRGARWGLAGLAGVWLSVAGVAGVFLAGAWLLTSHVAVYDNENLLHFSPVAMPLAILVPALVLGTGWGRRWGRISVYLTIFIAASAVVGALLKLLPMFDQVNGELIALVLPVNLALAAVVGWMGRGRGQVDTGASR